MYKVCCSTLFAALFIRVCWHHG